MARDGTVRTVADLRRLIADLPGDLRVEGCHGPRGSLTVTCWHQDYGNDEGAKGPSLMLALVPSSWGEPK